MNLSQEKPSIRLVFLLWQKYKKYCKQCYPSIESYLDMFDAFSRNHTTDNSDGRFWNHLYINKESSIGYDGESLKDILHYEIVEIIKKRLTR